MTKKETIYLEGQAKILNKFSSDFETLVKVGAKKVPGKNVYLISDQKEDPKITREARISFYKGFSSPIKKVAFDTRRTDQMLERNPRGNLQHYIRSEPFISEDFDKKLKQFHKLNEVLIDIEKDYHRDPHFLNSYAKELREHIKRGLSDGIGDGDYHKSHLSYLEQLIHTRYRFHMHDIDSLSSFEIRKAILSKDEKMLKMGKPVSYDMEKKSDYQPMQQPILVANGLQQPTQNDVFASLLNGLNNSPREPGKKVQRTITITISDEVI